MPRFQPDPVSWVRGTFNAVYGREIHPPAGAGIASSRLGGSMKRWRKASALPLLAAIGLALSGCSQSPLSPGNPAQSAGTGLNSTRPPVVSFGTDGTVGYIQAPVGDEVDSSDPAAALQASLRSTKNVDGGRGGVVRVGRFSVAIPPGAFSGSATVTMSMPDSNVMICDLSITPSSANRF